MRSRAKHRRKELEYAAWRFKREKRANKLATPGVHQAVLVLDNLKPDYNIGKIFRSADAFGVKEVHIVGTEFFDPIPAKGSFKWVPARFHHSFAECYDVLAREGYAFFALDSEQGSPLTQASIPERVAFILGHEEFGLSFAPATYPEITMLHIPQFGKVHCLNVSIAASVVLYEYVRQHGEVQALIQASGDL